MNVYKVYTKIFGINSHKRHEESVSTLYSSIQRYIDIHKEQYDFMEIIHDDDDTYKAVPMKNLDKYISLSEMSGNDVMLYAKPRKRKLVGFDLTESPCVVVFKETKVL